MTLLGLYQHLQGDAGGFWARIQVQFASAKNIWGSSQVKAGQDWLSA